MSFIELKNVCKQYANTNKKAVTDFNLKIDEKEFIAFVGPSGCGKSTTLRMIAGFEDITSGELYIDGKKMNEVAPRDRGISMVFLNYALYPHMTVEKNISYGLKNMKVPADEIKRKVDWAIEILGLSEYRYRKPKNLSGGQRQRVALGRAIVKDQKVFLMDEPLSNLDAKLRIDMRLELKRLQKELGITTLYVTHDQEEALTLSDRIAVFNNGYIEQVGTPCEIYNSSKSEFVCDFIGDINRFGTKILTSINEQLGTKLDVQKTGFIRIEKCVNNYMPNHAKITGTVTELEFNGILTKYTLSCMGETIKYLEKNDGYKYYKEGDEVDLYIDYQDIMQF